MKKCLILIGSMALVLGLIGCGRKKNEELPQETAPLQSNVEISEATEELQPETELGTDAALAGDTVGKILLSDFEQYIKENPEVSAEEMAEHILTNPIIQFNGASMPVEEGLLTGFNNAEITGFEEGVMFSPMIGSIPFVGYIFTLPEGADQEAFIRLLSDNADPRWNICTEADETVTGKAEKMIFFVMSPAQFE